MLPLHSRSATASQAPQPSALLVFGDKRAGKPRQTLQPSAFRFPVSGFRSPFSAFSPRAFTLTEMLVSISVMVLLIVLIAQLLNNATAVTTGSRKHLDADMQARLVFDRMATDFGAMLKRTDVDYVFNKAGGNDNFYVYSEAPAYFTGTANSQNSVALIGYRVNTTTFQLERLGKGLSWDGSPTASTPGSVVFLTYPAAPPAPAASPTPYPESTISGNWPTTADPASADTDYHVIADQVYRLEFCYLMKDGTYSLTRDTKKALDDVSAVVVTIGILDNTSRKTSAVTAATITAFADPADADFIANPPSLPSSKWNSALRKSDFPSKSGLSQNAAGNVRVYQRTFFLNRSL